jgi:carboxypeptidase C (cathepsin A)
LIQPHFSYQSKNDTHYNDTLSAQDVTYALADFLSFHTNFKDRPFYITGESYAGKSFNYTRFSIFVLGVYIPTTALNIMDQLNSANNGIFQNLGLNFQGFLIGNAYLSERLNVSFYIKNKYLYFYSSKPISTSSTFMD